MIEVANVIPWCVPTTLKALRPDNVGDVVLHRISLAQLDKIANPDPLPDSELDGIKLVRRFRSKHLGTGRQPPYHVLVRLDGVVEQMLPLMIQSVNAGSYNWCTWSVAVAGNYDERPISAGLLMTVNDVLSVLAVLPGRVSGHTELPGASGDPNKRCPGKFIHMDQIRAAVAARQPQESLTIEDRLAYVAQAGFVL